MDDKHVFTIGVLVGNVFFGSFHRFKKYLFCLNASEEQKKTANAQKQWFGPTYAQMDQWINLGSRISPIELIFNSHIEKYQKQLIWTRKG